MKKTTFSILLIICSVNFLWAREDSLVIKGRVLLPGNAPAQSANVSLLSEKDSSLIKIEITAADGGFLFTNVKQGNYLVTTTYTGYQKHIGQPLHITGRSLQLADIILVSSQSKLDNVTVTARKPMIEQHFDKLVFNVSGNVTAAGNSALEVLAKAPGVMVDQNGSVSLGGRAGVLILIDGKRTHLSGNDLASYLRGLPASTIDRIDLINNPSAQYEAEGTSGIIDIKLKKDDRVGYNGSLNLAYLQGTSASGNGSVNFNYRSKKLNVFGTVSRLYDEVDGKQITDRRYFTRGTVYNGLIHTDNDRSFTNNNYNNRVGADYYLGKKTIFGVVGMYNRGRTIADYITRTDNYFPGDSSNFALNRSINSGKRSNAAFNFNIKHSIDSTGREWNFDIDHVRYRNNDISDVKANFFSKDNIPNQPLYYMFGDMHGKLDVYSTRFDLTLPKTFGGNLQLGVRSSLVKADNELLFFDRSTGGNILDASKSNQFLYTENINAAYAHFQKKVKKWSLQTGLRMENTNGEGKQLTTRSTIKRSYVQLFPNIFTSYDASKNYTIGISFSRRIDRPSYSQLNPFRFYGSPDGYSEGNPFLTAPSTYVAELSNTFHKKYIVRFNYQTTSDVIMSVWGTDANNERISAQKIFNLDNLTRYRLSGTIPVNIGKAFTSFNNMFGEYHHYKGAAFGTGLNRGTTWFLVSSNNTYRINQSLVIELNAAGRSSQLSGGFQRMKPAAAVSAGIGKRILAGKGNLRLNVSDIFKTNTGHGLTTLNNFEIDVRQWNETRRATLSFSYNFGKSKVAAARTRTSSADEETRRAGN